MTPVLSRDALALITPDGALRLGAGDVGGKAYALARLSAAGERVPAWIVIPSDALAWHLTRAGALTEVERVLRELAALAGDDAVARSSVREAARILGAMIDGMPPTESLDGLPAAVTDALGAGPYAIRSSAVGEDGASLSFAGQFDTLLDVPVTELADAVRRCWRSAFGVRALDYRRRTGTLADAARLAVIVQRMVAGDASGVLFTMDPVTGDPTRMRVSACLGLGDALVSGEGDADEYLVTAEGAVVDAKRTAEPVLDDAQLRALAEVGKRIAAREGGPRDVEWTLCGGEVHVLQARPITALPADASGNRTVWDNSNIEESYCGVTTPLTFSFASAAYASVYGQTMRAVGVSDRIVVAHRPLLRTLLGLIRGRVYYNLNSWYRGLLLLPAFRRNKADMERMMGVTEPVEFVRDEKPSAGDRLRRLPQLARTSAGLLLAFARLDRAVPEFLAEFDARIAALDRGTLGGRGLEELMTVLDALWTGCVERWSTPIVNDFRVMMATGRLRRIVERALPGRGEALLQVLLGGADVAASAGPAMLMLRLAAIARGDAAVEGALRGDPESALRRAGGASAAFAAALEELMHVYGDRCMGELKLESRPLRDDAPFVLRMVRNYMGGELQDPSRLAASAASQRATAEREVAERLAPLGRARFRSALAWARRGIRAREQMRLARTRLFGTHRDVYRAIGLRLHEAGRLDRADDVFYLTTHEIRGYWEGTSAGADLAAVARARRAEFAGYVHERAPNRIVTTGAPHDSVAALFAGRAAPAGQGGRVLRGMGCSLGVAEGRVRIVRGPDDDLALDGHVLVAPRTDPGWAPLFPSARAIVVERGSLLSHSAVLARELGLPAVVGVPGVLDLLRDGELVRVDGSAGTIERLEVR